MAWPSREQLSAETLLWELDVADRLPSGGSISSTGTATLLNVNTNLAYGAGLSGASSSSGTKVRQKVTALEAGKRYLLTIPFTDSASNVQAAAIYLECTT